MKLTRGKFGDRLRCTLLMKHIKTISLCLSTFISMFFLSFCVFKVMCVSILHMRGKFTNPNRPATLYIKQRPFHFARLRRSTVCNVRWYFSMASSYKALSSISHYEKTGINYHLFLDSILNCQIISILHVFHFLSVLVLLSKHSSKILAFSALLLNITN